MKSIKSIFTLLLICVTTLVSCDKGDSSSGSTYYYGTWDVSLIVGHGCLTEIMTIKIDKSTVTMTFEKDGYYGTLYDKYGSSNTVSYTYNANDKDFTGETRESLTFDSPLYFVKWSDQNEYISKVFINKGEGITKGVVWSSEDLSHGLLLTK